MTIAVSNIDTHGICGKLFGPSDHDVRPGIVVLGGSGGGLGWSEAMAQKLAGEGYAALALAYFRYPSLPNTCANIPLEYFQKAFDWMAAQQDIDTRRLAIVGASRGAELVLILGSIFPVIKAVIAYSPSSVVWGAFGGITSVGKPAWTYQKKPLVRMHIGLSPRILYEHVRMVVCLISRFPYSERHRFVAALKNESAVNRAIIPVENIKGPILLVSGEDDQIWPATLMSEMIMDRLRKHEHPFHDKHCQYKGAGHAISLPDLPREAYPTKFTFPRTRIKYNAGGNSDINAQASKQAWNEATAFLQEHVMC